MERVKSYKHIVLGGGALLLLVIFGTFLIEEQHQRKISQALSEQSLAQKEQLSRDNFKYLDPVSPSLKYLELSAPVNVDLSGITQEQRMRDVVRAEIHANLPPPPMPEDKIDYRPSTVSSFVETPSIISKVFDNSASTTPSYETPKSTLMQNTMTTYIYNGKAVQCTNYSNASAQYCY